MWGLHKKGLRGQQEDGERDFGGGILGDDMGMGKTVQVSAFLGSLLYSEMVDYCLVILPLAVMNQWQKEVNSDRTLHKQRRSHLVALQVVTQRYVCLSIPWRPQNERKRITKVP